MNKCIINLIEDYNFNNSLEGFSNLSQEDQQAILNWYREFSSEKNVETNKILNLMSYLYIKSDLDLYTDMEFSRVRDYLSQIYSIPQSKFLDMFIKFKKIVFGS